MWQTEQLLWTSPKSKAITGPKIWSNNCEYKESDTFVCIACVFWSHWATICSEVRPKNISVFFSGILSTTAVVKPVKDSQRTLSILYTDSNVTHAAPEREREKRLTVMNLLLIYNCPFFILHSQCLTACAHRLERVYMAEGQFFHA